MEGISSKSLTRLWKFQLSFLVQIFWVLENPLSPQEILIPYVSFSETVHLQFAWLFAFKWKEIIYLLWYTVHLFYRIVSYAQILVEFSRRQILGSKWRTIFFPFLILAYILKQKRHFFNPWTCRSLQLIPSYSVHKMSKVKVHRDPPCWAFVVINSSTSKSLCLRYCR